MNRIRIPNKWDGESVAETVPKRQLATEKRWKHPNRARTTSEKPIENRGAHRADIDFGVSNNSPSGESVCGRQCSSVQHAAVKDSEPDGAGVSSGCR